ncbi:nitrate reductase molybdenum cofactor assembly chaperone [Gordonia sp. VNK21]|uniref:nitrate reductase molybdenum cofactor assembly chaperone n=1 Tax=Gordonia sp. VNK21 TaxID=3382483 RepID=UPI0038D461E0
MRTPFSTRRRHTTAPALRDHRVAHLVASLALGYPDDELLARLPSMAAALAEQPPGDEAAAALTRLVDWLGRTDPEQLRRDYVDVFDLSRRHTLYLSFWSEGDTRHRGTVLTEFKQVYRESGFLVDTHGELPDYLPMVLEFAARVDPVRGAQLLQDNRPAIELIRLALLEKDSGYADALVGVCHTLPGPSPADKAAVRALREATTPIELVGLQPYDPRLLPLSVDGQPGRPPTLPDAFGAGPDTGPR